MACTLAAMALWTTLAVAAAAPAGGTSASGALAEADVALLSLRVNGERKLDGTRVLLATTGEVWVRLDDLGALGLEVGALERQSLDGDLWVPLSRVPLVEFGIDSPSQELRLQAAPGAFRLTTLRAGALPDGELRPSDLGGFLNYDVSVASDGGRETTSGLAELGISYGTWVGTTSLASAGPGGGNGIDRLETTWSRDDPSRMASLRVGDSVATSAAVGRPVRFGGLQWATNFKTRPGFVTYPLPTLRGEAALPSVVDLYIDGALRSHLETGTGPFEIRDPPLVRGSGELELRVIDATGREQVIVEPFYVSEELLASGLHQYGFQLGFLREGRSDGWGGYGRLFASGSYRRGVTDRWTAELHAELTPDAGMAAAGAQWLIPGVGRMHVAVGASSAAAGTGGSVTVGFERRRGRFGIGFESTRASDAFVQLGAPGMRGASGARRLDRIQASVSPRRFGSLSLSCLRRRQPGAPDVALLSASYLRRLSRSLLLSVSYQHSELSTRSDLAAVTLTALLGGGRTVSGRLRSAPTGDRTAIRLQRRPAGRNGFGYRLTAEDGPSPRYAAAADVETRAGRIVVEAAEAGARRGFRLSMNGAVVALGGSLLPTRSLSQSFALVRVADLPGVRIYADNQPVARTGSRGVALVPDLRPYQPNPIRIESDDLPLTARIDALEIDVTPYHRGGVVVRFPVRSERAALVILVRGDGAPVPAGARVSTAGDGEPHRVGLRGEVFVTGIGARERLTAVWAGGSCSAELDLPPGDDPLPEVAPLPCLPEEPR